MDDLACRSECIGRCDHLVALADAHGLEAQVQSGSTRVQSYGVARPYVRAKLSFEAGDLGTCGDPAALQDSAHGIYLIGADVRFGKGQIRLWFHLWLFGLAGPDAGEAE